VDGDGNLDAVFANAGQSNRVCLGDGAGNFTCSDISADTNNSQSVALLALTQIQTTTVPTMTEWGIIIFIVLAGMGSIYSLRRKGIEN
jgi:hypothetical protein